MKIENLSLLSSRARLILATVVLVLTAATIWAVAYVWQTAPSRHIVLASGLEDGLLHQHARRYIEILARSGVTVEERITNGPGDNLKLLQDPNSGVDIGFTQGGIVQASDADNVVMLASLYYVPLWIFYRKTEPLNYVNELRDRRVAVGASGSGARSLSESVFALNGLSPDNVNMQPLSNLAALVALRGGDVDAAIFVDGADNPAVWNALRDPKLSLFNFARADAYRRRLNFISTLKLPSGVIDLADNIPEKEVELIGTKEMLAARRGLHPALVHLLVDAAREIHGRQGLFEDAGEFPGTTQVDLPVSADADQHRRFGRTFLYQYLPFWIAALAERAAIILLPLAAILFPLFHYLPQLVRWHVRSRIFRWYGELALLERDVAARTGKLPIDTWLADLARIEEAVARIHTPTGFASEAYTLREHIGLVRRAITARDNVLPAAAAPRNAGKA
ncbi:ABC transporter substrate-binding protein [Bradyrhizobium diazoefficiens]|nr:ABC transporter substrate-binding protein [Bradyrhizobium diazoefficiens]